MAESRAFIGGSRVVIAFFVYKMSRSWSFRRVISTRGTAEPAENLFCLRIFVFFGFLLKSYIKQGLRMKKYYSVTFINKFTSRIEKPRVPRLPRGKQNFAARENEG